MTLRYTDGHGGRLLVFPKDWGDANLPPCRADVDSLSVRLLDTETGKTYDAKHIATYEDDLHSGPEPGVTLQDYFYAQHFCQCHRKSAAIKAGADTDEECEGNRFVVDRITAPSLPDLILYSETIPIEELEAALLQTK